MADGAGRDRSGLGPGKRKERVRPESTSRVLARAGSSDTRDNERRRRTGQGSNVLGRGSFEEKGWAHGRGVKRHGRWLARLLLGVQALEPSGGWETKSACQRIFSTTLFGVEVSKFSAKDLATAEATPAKATAMMGAIVSKAPAGALPLIYCRCTQYVRVACTCTVCISASEPRRVSGLVPPPPNLIPHCRGGGGRGGGSGGASLRPLHVVPSSCSWRGRRQEGRWLRLMLIVVITTRWGTGDSRSWPLSVSPVAAKMMRHCLRSPCLLAMVRGCRRRTEGRQLDLGGRHVDGTMTTTEVECHLCGCRAMKTMHGGGAAGTSLVSALLRGRGERKEKTIKTVREPAEARSMKGRGDNGRRKHESQAPN
ncbi:hypothetical protein [Oryza sativa Japonica Group]|uniref:Uncharacterized protein n=1 Tax=Oryza sativa subsp. japonica TaxID=39947 RepID=Q5NB23_ORYSJ|nr:hypothetical protein [Oryza sativa Japonica Group]BAD86864.1 hypothetical protein [Oryza sativa Japonica Group]